ncbi:MAG TPA: polyphosphate kinase 1 [Candidatus Krumholzibacteria bacterium]
MSRTPLVNREIGWLSFNERVLQEAADPEVPLIERLKFIGICSSNLEEFFRVRVATLQRMVDAGISQHKMVYGEPKKVLQSIHEIVLAQRERFETVFAGARAALEAGGIFIVDEKHLLAQHRPFVQAYFDDVVRPSLAPVILDSIQEFPYLRNGVIYLAVRLSGKHVPESTRHSLVEVPSELPRFLVLPAVGEKRYVIMLDDVIRFGLREVFSIFEVEKAEAYTIKVTRDAEIEIDDDVTVGLFEKLTKSLKKRKEGPPVRFVYDRDIPADFLEVIVKRANLRRLDNTIPGGRYHNARDFVNFPNVNGAELEYKPQPPLAHPALRGKRGVLAEVRERDVLLHTPYHSFHPIIDLLREAAIDPKVKAIKMTLYRVAKDSRIVNALVNAVRNGKKVTVLLEVQARFDEEANLRWARALEDEGARLMGGVPGLKVHAKLALISRREEGKTVQYAVVGTGNFNETTALTYADHFLLTADRRITAEVGKVFDFLETTYKRQSFGHLVVSPFDMREVLLKQIRREIKNAKKGRPAYIDAKLNSLVDRQLIEALYEASQAGVRVQLIVRGTCSLVPGVAGISENISGISIVDRYLEHSRVIFFCNGGSERCYLGSADWMTRNLDYRLEVAVPVYDPEIRAELRYYFNLQLRDTARARIIDEGLTNSYRRGAANHRAQVEIYRWLARAHSGPRRADKDKTEEVA